MKIVVGFLVVAVIVLTIAVATLATPRETQETEELTAAQLAQILNIKYWRYRVPDDSDAEARHLGLEFVTPERSYHSQGVKVPPGAVVKIFLRPVGEGEKLRFTFVYPVVDEFGGSGEMSTWGWIDNAFRGHPTMGRGSARGNLVEDGVLMKGVHEVGQSVSFEESKPHDMILRIVVRDDAFLPSEVVGGSTAATATASEK